MIFAREISDPLTSLVKKVNEVSKDKGLKMGNVVVFLSDDEALDKSVKELAEKEKLDKALLMKANPAGPEELNLSKDAAVTVVLYVNKTVKVNRAYKKGEFKAEEVDKVIKDLPKILEGGK
jgi:hypothetical protein